MTERKTNGKMLIIIGFVIIGIIFILYSRITDFSITEDSIQSIERVAIGFYLILLMSFGAIGYGIYRYHQRKITENEHGILTTIAKLTRDSKSRKFLLSHHLHMVYFFH